MKPFLFNHQYNRIVQQARVLLSALQTSTDRKVVEAARYSAVSKSLEACPGLQGDALQLLERLGELQSTEEFQSYMNELAGYTFKFPAVTERQLKALFPKVKKLHLPDLEGMEERSLSYLAWTDPGGDKLFLVYPRRDAAGEGVRLTGIEGRFVSMNKKGICAFCKKTGEAALFTAVSKKKMAQNPDYFKAVGQYICVDSAACNARITELDVLDQFFDAVMG
ncbi:hypothetical protein J2T17_003189 [Paenibacillus mucilaginosus]|uniref:FusB/FusC family EF-G-binding protein n=1 Tax=Paenibacillus mucilaginosus TaxID=61624 RepID=UPI003D1EBE93